MHPQKQSAFNHDKLYMRVISKLMALFRFFTLFFCIYKEKGIFSMNHATRYKCVLDELEAIRKAIIEHHMDEISLGGRIPKEDAFEIETILRIESLVLTHLMSKGLSYTVIDKKPQFVQFEINGTIYINHKDFFPMLSGKESPVKEEEENTEQEEFQPATTESTAQKEVVISPNPNITENLDDQRRVKASDLVFETFKVSLQPQSSNVSEVFTIMCAPLKLYKYETPSVPIVVSIADSDDKRITKSSYDAYETGKNLVQIDIKDYSLLFRGSFDDEGIFHTMITTTGDTANRGDKLSLIEQQTFGAHRDNQSGYGHPHISYQSDEGDAFVVVLPLLDTKTEKFIVISKTEEFVQYMESASAEYGSHTAQIYDMEGEKNVLPHWVDNYLEVDIL